MRTRATRALRSWRALALMGLLLSALTPPATAWADHNHVSVIMIPGPFMTLTSSTSTTGAAFFAPLFTTVKLVADNGEASEEMVAFLSDHHLDLQQDLALGGGASIDALAHLLDVPQSERQAFGRALFEEREALLNALQVEQVNVEHATRFVHALDHAGVRGQG
ncbi:DUF3015 family protein [Lujinxingia litoralis]|nr:DUF3015 family protein [Lujinxingia litoralis]